MIFTHGQTKGRLSKTGSDAYGRWSWIRLNTEEGGIYVISIYQPSNQQDYKTPGNKSKMTFWLQQFSMIVKDNRKGTPREIFCKDLIKFLTEIKSSGDKILIMGDFNEVLSTKSGIF